MLILSALQGCQVDIATARLILERPTCNRDPSLLRRAIAHQHDRDSLWHQHDESGRVIYRYPSIHYRWQDRDPELIGFQAGAMALEGTDFTGAVLRIGQESIKVRRVVRQRRAWPIGFASMLRQYRFVTPWLAFGTSELVRKFQAMDERAQARELDRLVTGAVIMAVGGCSGVRLGDRVLAMTRITHVGRYRYKETDFHGFSGELFVNLDLPDGLAIGRAVSVGFGVIEREDT